MDIIFEQDYLSELYYTGKTSDKSHRYQPQVVRKYIRVIDILASVVQLEDLFKYNSLNFEALDNGYYSVRIDYHYRLFFRMDLGEDNIIITEYISDITNHYK